MSREHIHHLRLNETKEIENGIVIIRVPGYWIYMLPNGSSQKIEISSEFSKKNNVKITKEKVVSIISKHLELDEKFHLIKRTVGPHNKGKKILIKILYENLKINHFSIADFLEFSGHSTSIHSLRTANRMLKNDIEYKKDYKDILRRVLQYNNDIN